MRLRFLTYRLVSTPLQVIVERESYERFIQGVVQRIESVERSISVTPRTSPTLGRRELIAVTVTPSNMARITTPEDASGIVPDGFNF
jgi:hypothetical protein